MRGGAPEVLNRAARPDEVPSPPLSHAITHTNSLMDQQMEDPRISMTELSLALAAIEDWLREQPARHADEMADRVHDAWRVIDDLADQETAGMGRPEPPGQEAAVEVREFGPFGMRGLMAAPKVSEANDEV